MAEILDLIAKVSWQTNQAELDKLNKAIDKQDDMLTELIRKGQRLEQQRAKADNPAKAKELNKAMEANKKAIDSITAAQQKQSTATLDLINKQKQLAKAIAEATDPKQARALLAEFKKVEAQIKSTEKSASGFSSKLGSIGQSILGGLGLGVGSMGLESLVSGIKSFVTSANQEFIDAEKTSLRLQNTLKNLGQGQYFDQLTSEADGLAKAIGYLDNDDIVSAQQKMLAYGKLSKNEISKLLPVIINLAAAMGSDVPSATETMINIMEGRGGETLRQLGISIKDVGSTSERLAVIFNELGPTLEGNAEVLKRSSEGMQMALNQSIKDLEESVGKSTIKIKNFFTQAYGGLLLFIKDATQSEEEARQEIIDRITNKYKALNDEQLTAEKYKANELVKINQDYEQRIANLKIARKRKGTDAMTYDEIIQNEDLLRKYAKIVESNKRHIEAINKAYADRQANAEARAAEDAAIKAERDAEDAKAKAEANAKKQAEAQQKRIEDEKKRYQDLKTALEKDRADLDAFNVDANAKEINEVNKKYDALLKQAKGYSDLILIIEANRTSALIQLEKKANKDIEALTAKRYQVGDAEASAQMSKDAEIAKRNEEWNKSEGKKKMNADAERWLKEKQLKDAQTAQDIKDAEEEKARKAKERQDIFDNLQAVASAAQSIISVEQEKNDRLIALQQDRINAARGNASESLKIEEDRLQGLLEKRQKFERAQRTIDAAVIVANQAVTISTAIRNIVKSSSLGPAGVAAEVVAIIAGLAASIAAVKSATADIPQFREGGYTGDGNPDNVSTTLGKRPYIYHKKEFVMDEGLTSKHRELFEGLHKREMVVKKLDDGQFYITKNGLDTTKLVDDHISIKNQMQTDSIVYQLNAINEKLGQREVNITNTFDSLGFGNVIATQLGRIEINKKLR